MRKMRRTEIIFLKELIQLAAASRRERPSSKGKMVIPPDLEKKVIRSLTKTWHWWHPEASRTACVRKVCLSSTLNNQFNGVYHVHTDSAISHPEAVSSVVKSNMDFYTYISIVLHL